MRCSLLLILLLATAVPASAEAEPRAERLLSATAAWPAASVLAVSTPRQGDSPERLAGRILAVYCDESSGALALRVSLVAPIGIQDGRRHFVEQDLRVSVLLDEDAALQRELPSPLKGVSPFAWSRALELAAHTASLRDPARGTSAKGIAPEQRAVHLEHGWLAAVLPSAGVPVERLLVIVHTPDGRELDRLSIDRAKAMPAGPTHVAFLHHGNQGLAHTDVLKGRPGAEGSSGFDEVLRIHEQRNIPGNFHLSALLQSSAEWSRNNGDPLDFNGWLRAGVVAGWAGMVSSAYGQPIMPFLQGPMNAWAIDRDHDMVAFRYGYDPGVAWVPERVFLDPGTFPNQGVLDWSGAHWQANGIQAVVLDDWPHCAGHSKNRIHTLQGNGLRIIPRDGDFTGRILSGDGAGALGLLTDLANSGVGQYRITVYADDWEMAAEVAGWESVFPFGLDTYDWMIGKCQSESAWLHTWKLDPAIANSDFNGDTFTPTYGTYSSIGGTQGYGGNNNAWYGDWAGYVPFSTGGDGNGGCGGGGNCRNHGQLWNDAHAALQAAPDNKIRETGWYVLMTNLHETGWHDHLGGTISGWERQYSAHIKNASVYAEAARWAGGLYTEMTGAFLADLDGDGIQELAIHNDRVFGMFESIGGRCTHLFAKGPGHEYSVVGIDNAYWAGTEGDYNDVNHIAALSDVGPNTQNDLYALQVDIATGSTVQATMSRGPTRKTVRLTAGAKHLDVVYRVGTQTQYIQSGFSPDIVDLLYNAEMERVWGGGPQTYMGQRNPNTGATAAYVLGAGGASHQSASTSTLMKVDEIVGTQKFQFYLFAGATSPPDGFGQIAELEALRASLTDQLAPEAVRGTYFPSTRQLTLTFDEPIQSATISLPGIRIDSNNDGVPEITLDGASSVLTSGNAATVTLSISSASHTAIQALPNKNALELLLTAGAVRDAAGNLCATLTHTGDVRVSYGPPTLITLDGRFDPSEWPVCAIAAADSFDSQWNAGPGEITNEIHALYATWDSTYLYLGLRGVVTGNSWVLYLDTDPNGPNGQTNLTAIDAWERGASFTAPGFRPDWQLGAYQHQGPFDSQSFHRILSPTTSANYSDSTLRAFDPQHQYGLSGGSELAIPWSVLYGLGLGRVPNGASLGLAAALCWDPEPNGQLGGDVVPNNTSAALPVIDGRVLIPLDANSDGVPDPIDRTPPALVSVTPAGYDSVLVLGFSERLSAQRAQTPTRYTVYESGNPTEAVPVLGATLLAGAQSVRLLVAGLRAVPYTVVANGIADSSCFSNIASQTQAHFQGPPVAIPPGLAPLTLELSAPWPNPSRDGRMLLRYRLPETATETPVRLALFDASGRRVRSLLDGPQPAGEYRISFDGMDASGQRLAAGLYFVRVSRGAMQMTRRVVVMR